MLLVHSGDPVVALAVRAAMPAGAALRILTDWRELERLAPDAAGAVVHVPGAEAAAELSPRLRRLAARVPLLPVLALTPRSPEVLVHLLNTGLAETVWSDDPPPALAAALARMRGPGLLERLAARVERSAVAPAALREALAAAVRGPRPPTRVTQLAALAFCDRTTLWKYWRAAVREGSALLPGEFVGWVLLLHATLRKRPGRSWGAVAGELGIHEHTLGRLAQRLAGSTLRVLAEEEGRNAFLARFGREVAGAFRGDDASQAVDDLRLSRTPEAGYVESRKPTLGFPG